MNFYNEFYVAGYPLKSLNFIVLVRWFLSNKTQYNSFHNSYYLYCLAYILYPHSILDEVPNTNPCITP